MTPIGRASKGDGIVGSTPDSGGRSCAGVSFGCEGAAQVSWAGRRVFSSRLCPSAMIRCQCKAAQMIEVSHPQVARFRASRHRWRLTWPGRGARVSSVSAGVSWVSRGDLPWPARPRASGTTALHGRISRPEGTDLCSWRGIVTCRKLVRVGIQLMENDFSRAPACGAARSGSRSSWGSPTVMIMEHDWPRERPTWSSLPAEREVPGGALLSA